jgi:ankyrin repeat protein
VYQLLLFEEKLPRKSFSKLNLGLGVGLPKESARKCSQLCGGCIESIQWSGSLVGFVMQLSKRAYEVCYNPRDPSVQLRAFLKANPSVDVNLYKDVAGYRALNMIVGGQHVKCLRLLIGVKADVNARTKDGRTPVFWSAFNGDIESLQVLIDAKANVQTPERKGVTPAIAAAQEGHSECLNLLINAKADVNAKTIDDETAAMRACQEDRLRCLQLLVDTKADLSVKSNMKCQALYFAVRYPRDGRDRRELGMPFAVLSCGADPLQVRCSKAVTHDMVNAYFNEYQQIQAFIDEYHTVTMHALSEDVVVDKRVGRRGNGLYHEPLERVLFYLGMSMKKDQDVNISIDRKIKSKRALIPGHPTNANLWYELYQRAHCSSCSTRVAKPKKCPCHAARYCNTDCQRQHWKTHRRIHKAELLKKKRSF